MKKVLYFLSILTIPTTLATSIGTSYKQSENLTPYHQLYVIGDSLSDTGGFVGAGTDFVKSTWWLPIHQVTLDDPYYQNKSFSNGEVAAQVLANKLNLNLTPGWKYTTFWGMHTHEQIGSNYAVGGAVSANNNSWTGDFFSDRFSADKQMDALLSQHQDLQSNDLVLLEAGNNDILAALDTSSTKKQEQIIENSINNEEYIINTLINNGVKHIIVSDVGDFSKVPQFNNSSKKELAAQLSSSYNKQWREVIDKCSNNYPNIIKEYSLYNALPKYMDEFKAQGKNIINNAIEPNYTSLIYSGRVKTKYVNGATYNTLNNYFFFDDVHPSALIHQYVGTDLYNLVKSW